jgi:hypothetical protein
MWIWLLHDVASTIPARSACFATIIRGKFEVLKFRVTLHKLYCALSLFAQLWVMSVDFVLLEDAFSNDWLN